MVGLPKLTWMQLCWIQIEILQIFDKALREFDQPL